jgi:hypothetical protein
VLAVAFREDENRVRTGHAAKNLAVLRHVGLNLMRGDTTGKAGIKAKRLTCGWYESCPFASSLPKCQCSN